MVTKLLFVLVSVILTSQLFQFASTFELVDPNVVVDGCDCKEVDVVSNRDVVLRKHSDVLGRYTRIDGIQGGTSNPSYVHASGKYFLYYSTQSQVGNLFLC